MRVHRAWYPAFGLALLAAAMLQAADEKPPQEKPAVQKPAEEAPSNLNEEDLEKILRHLLQSPSHRNRTLGEKLKTVRERDPQQLSAVLTAKMAKMLLEEIERRNANPELFDQRETQKQLQQDIYSLAKRIRGGEDKVPAEKLTRDLQRLLDEEYETRLKIRQLELADLESRIDTLKEELEKQKRAKDRFIEDRLQRLTAVPEKGGNKNAAPGAKNEIRNAVVPNPSKK